MKSLLLFVAIAALFLASASAQNCTLAGCEQCTSLVPSSTCFEASFKRVKSGEYCGFCATAEDNTFFYCGEDEACTGTLGDSSATCMDVTVKEIGESCDSTAAFEVCAEKDFQVACITNGQGAKVCGGVRVYGPGEACQTDSDVLSNGDGCYAGECTGGTCPGAAEGESCTTNFCNVGLYCDESEICRARIAIASACVLLDTNGNDETSGSNHGCAANADCINGFCVEYYSRPEGEACGDDTYWSQEVCQEGLVCDFRSTTEPFNCIVVEDGAPCNVDADTCGDYRSCQCNYGSGTGVCISTENRVGKAFRAAYECLVKSQCWFELDYFEEGCVNEDCGSEAAAVISELRSAADDVNKLLGRPSVSSAVHVVLSVAVAFAVALAL